MASILAQSRDKSCAGRDGRGRSKIRIMESPAAPRTRTSATVPVNPREHPTSNIQRPTSKDRSKIGPLRPSMLEVGGRRFSWDSRSAGLRHGAIRAMRHDAPGRETGAPNLAAGSRRGGAIQQPWKLTRDLGAPAPLPASCPWKFSPARVPALPIGVGKCFFTTALATALFAIVVNQSAAQPTPLIHAHAHNDYLHARPLLDALDHGFCSVEADIYLVEGQLLVAHDRDKVKPDRTLQSLYLDPLRERVRKNGGRVYPNGPEFN